MSLTQHWKSEGNPIVCCCSAACFSVFKGSDTCFLYSAWDWHFYYIDIFWTGLKMISCYIKPQKKDWRWSRGGPWYRREKNKKWGLIRNSDKKKMSVLSKLSCQVIMQIHALKCTACKTFDLKKICQNDVLNTVDLDAIDTAYCASLIQICLTRASWINECFKERTTFKSNISY